MARIPITDEMKREAAEIVAEKRADGYGKTRTTVSSMDEDDVESLYNTGALGEVAFARYCEYEGYDYEHKPRGHDFDFEVNGVDIDVKATGAGRAEIEISKVQVARKDSTPDIWLKIDVTDSVAEIVGFVTDSAFRSEAHEVNSVFGNGEGWRIFPSAIDYVQADHYLTSVFETERTKYEVKAD